MLTYAQNFEDIILERIFQGQEGGFYIDVGAWHPTKHSVTRHFYDKNWRGINIEPIKRQFDLFVESRPEDINLNLAVGRAPSRMEFFECVTDTALSTLNPAQALALSRRGFEIVKYEIEVTTLERVIDEHCSAREVDFLKIDVEGWEEQVLKGLDFRRSSPRVLVIEATKPAAESVNWDRVSEIERWQSWEELVLSAGYQFAYYDGLSRFYLRTDIAELKHRLTLPPGVYDSIEYPQVRELSEKLCAVDADRGARLSIIDRLERERASDVEHFTATLARLEQELKARLEIIERLSAQLRESERDRAARLDVIERLNAQLLESERDRAARLDVIERLGRERTWDVGHLTGTVTRLEEELKARLEVIQRLSAQLQESERDRAARLDVIERLSTQLNESEEDRAARLDVIERLDAQLKESERDRVKLTLRTSEAERKLTERIDLLEKVGDTAASKRGLETDGCTMKSDVAFAIPTSVQSVDDCLFYHTLDLPVVGTVSGHWDLRGRFGDYVSRVDLKSKRVLDVGTASGFLTWEAERSGCGEIISFDADSAARYQKLPFEGIQWSMNYEEWLIGANQFWRRLRNSWWFAHQTLGSTAKRFEGSVYEIPSALGMFDVVMVGQILVHLRDGISALESIAARCAETLVIAEGMVDVEEPSGSLLGRAGHPETDYAFWHYSLGFYREILGMLGFEIHSVGKSEYLCNLLQPPRGVEITTVVARRKHPRSAG